MGSSGKPPQFRAKSASQAACNSSPDRISVHKQEDENDPHKAPVSPFVHAAYLPDLQKGATPGMGDHERRTSRLSTVLSWKLSSYHSSCSSQGSRACGPEEGPASSMGLSRKSHGEDHTRTPSRDIYRTRRASDDTAQPSRSKASLASSSSRRHSLTVPSASSLSQESRGSSMTLQDAASQGYAVPTCQAIKHRSWCGNDTSVADHIAHQAQSANRRPWGMKTLPTLLQKDKGRNKDRSAMADLGEGLAPRPSIIQEAWNGIFG
ncbi:hypothetical protein DUNSADRAFT_4239 [Dunaliella salina]|uniref:Encoded protein n=1 Tax=Dunaliella salina TaxID=3046 RepID=A0ABQ7GSF1_DUNSA|nr:hypothetical protein DUNSADRAFT_4239 [Dunaliella salina]|eukprot:KAF5837546.1 hypothetical protein DUNSADRAFT_4239 [Dunaliella salina]